MWFSGFIRFLPDFAGFSDVKSGKKFLFVLLATRRIFPENFSTIWQLILWKLQLSGFFRIFPEKPDHRSGFFWTKKSPHAKDGANKKKFSQIGSGVPEWEQKTYYVLSWPSSRPPKLLHYMNSLSMRAGWQIEEFKNFSHGGRWR